MAPTTWSYSGDPQSSLKDAVRFFVQDTVEQDQQISDEEVEFLLADENQNTMRAAARAAEVIAAMYARQVDKSVGGLSLSAGRRQEKYERLAQKLWSRANTVGTSLPFPYAGGVSQSDKDIAEEDSDRVQPAFTRDMMEYVSDLSPDPNA